MKNGKIRHVAIVGAIAGSIVSALAMGAPASAAEVGGAVTGGWDEVSGTFSSGAVSGIGTFASPNHRGASEEKVISGTTNKRAHGWTTWAGTRHYTTAQLEHYWPASGVIATSGRQWGTGGTEAVSPWKAFNPNAASNGNGMAKTYYGR